MGLPNAQWRVSETLNAHFQTCPTYPATLVVPTAVTDAELSAAAPFRFSHRFPVLVWKHPKALFAIFRCSQPHVIYSYTCLPHSSAHVHISVFCANRSFSVAHKQQLGIKRKRNEHDELLLKAFAAATAPPHTSSAGVEWRSAEWKGPPLLIADCRPTVNAVGNVAKGGGWEVQDNYPHTKLQFLGAVSLCVLCVCVWSQHSLCFFSTTHYLLDIANIHVVRDSFQELRGLFLVLRAPGAAAAHTAVTQFPPHPTTFNAATLK
jgi:hypothetical protein